MAVRRKFCEQKYALKFHFIILGVCAYAFVCVWWSEDSYLEAGSLLFVVVCGNKTQALWFSQQVLLSTE